MESNNPGKDNSAPLSIPNPSGFNPKYLIILLIFLALCLSGCITLADPEASQVYISDSVGLIDSHTAIGQSFISRRPNLNGITIWLSPSLDQDGEAPPTNPNYLNIELYTSSEKSTPVFATTLIVPRTGTNVPLTIIIPNQNNPPGQEYYVLLTLNQGSLQINGRNEDAYPYGQAYINTIPVNADIAFRLNYEYDFSALVNDFKGFFTSFWIAVPLLVVLWLPGWLILDVSGFRTHFDFGEQTAMSIGLSLAIIPVVMLWTTILNVKWTGRAVFFAAGFLIALWLARLVFIFFTSIKYRPTAGEGQSTGQTPRLHKYLRFVSGKSFLLVLIFFGSLAVRLIMVRDLATPAWVDSVHHALITRLILESGGFPSSYLPYLDISPSAYHPGFHSIAAAFTWLSKLDIAQSLIILGQVLNALNVFSVYLFTTVLTRSSSAGLFAAILTGFITPMPAYYTSWGRYTELTGLLVLPVILALLQVWLDTKKHTRFGLIILLGTMTAGGLFMIHYRVITFLAALLFSFILLLVLTRMSGTQRKTGQLLLLLAIMTILAILSVFPWFIQTLKTTVLPIVKTPLTTSVPFFQDFTWPYLTSALGKQSLVLAGLGLLWGIIKGRRFAFVLLLWVLMLFLIANVASLKLPGGGLISNASVEIMLFIPISILGGFFFDQVLLFWKDLFPRKLVTPAAVIIFIAVGFASYLGARQLIPIINPITILARSADLPAIQWINDHLPEDETIVINPFAWGYGLYAGSDGGYWISPLSGRLTLPPPVLYGLSKAAGEINQLSQDIIDLSPDPASFREFLISNQYQYVYAGAKGGVIAPENLVSSGLFSLLYHQDGVWILSIKP